MSKKVEVYLFDEHIANIYQEEDRVYFEQIYFKAHKASPISVSDTIGRVETTSLKFLEKVPGFVSDSLPGNFGTEILNSFYEANNGSHPTVVDKLLFIGNRGLGAVVYKPQFEIDESDEETLNLKDMFERAKELKRDGDFHSIHSAFLVGAHSFVGGARSKAVASINLETKEVYLGDRTKKLPDGFIPAIIKYDDTQGDNENKSTYSKLEYVYYLLVKEVGINISECYLVESEDKHHFVTRRFDVDEKNNRKHVHSLAGLLETDYNIPKSSDYRDLLRTAVTLGAQSSVRQLFKQMLFNYFFVNQDDHTRNFSFMCDNDYRWKATPAYDITFAKGEKQTVEHQMTLYGKSLSTIGLEDLLMLSEEFSIHKKDEELESDIMVMVEARNNLLEPLMKKYEISKKKSNQVLKETSSRTLQGAL